MKPKTFDLFWGRWVGESSFRQLFHTLTLFPKVFVSKHKYLSLPLKGIQWTLGMLRRVYMAVGHRLELARLKGTSYCIMQKVSIFLIVTFQLNVVASTKLLTNMYWSDSDEACLLHCYKAKNKPLYFLFSLGKGWECLWVRGHQLWYLYLTSWCVWAAVVTLNSHWGVIIAMHAGR